MLAGFQKDFFIQSTIA